MCHEIAHIISRDHSEILSLSILYKNLKVKRNNSNSIIIKDNAFAWAKKIKECFKSNKYDYLGSTARENSKNYSWINRVIKIKEFNEK